uniref:Plastid zeaxanthin epoxidase n=2 Tax=Madagascaria erythrocladioides TaxID=753684 RepID=A0A291HVG6_9RHOD|nr:plastid zeaxanthin epoxidase precursor [Madagascaria erythrocladioides]
MLAFATQPLLGRPKRLSTGQSSCPRRRQTVVASLKVAVAGGGLGGLAVAGALLQKGFDVRVYEQASSYKPFGGPIQVQSNALALLQDINESLTRAISAEGTATGNRKSGIKDGLSDAWYCQFDTGAPAKKRNLPLTHVIDRPKLQEALAKFVISQSPRAIRTSSRVVGYCNHADHVDVLLENGTTESADVLVGADGIWSSVRAQMHGEDARSSASYSGYHCFTATCKYVSEDVDEISYKIYLGKKQYFVASDVGQGRVQWYAFLGRPAGSETQGEKLGFLSSKFDGWSPEVQEILNATEEGEVEARDLYDRAPFVRKGWIDERVVLLGDAAHPMMPNLGQGGCMAFEDAYTLASSLGELGSNASRDQVHQALERYQRKRFGRTAIVQGLAQMSSNLLFHYERLATGGVQAFLGWGVFWSTIGSVIVGGSMPLVLDFLYVNLVEQRTSDIPESPTKAWATVKASSRQN